MDAVNIITIIFAFLAFGLSCASFALNIVRERRASDVWEPTAQDIKLEEDLQAAEDRMAAARREREQTPETWEDHERMFRELMQ